MGDSNVRSILNLANSIVGVSILAMPYCFSKCGIILGTLLLISCTIVTQWSCKMLMKVAVMTRNHTFENIAHSVLGDLGKYFTGLSVIGLNLGTCIAFFVIIGDLAPPIIAQATAVNWSLPLLRAVILCMAALFVTFPLGLLRSVDSLSAISVGSILFYMILVLQLFQLFVQNLVWGLQYEVNLWDNSGLLKCIPIFALAFACQTQLFVIYAALQDSSFRRISVVINGATYSVASLYFLVAFFGYVSFYNIGVKGDVLSNFGVGLFSQLSRLGFSVSVMVSFPLMIFPCRMCINSLFFSRKSQELHVEEPIPQQRFVVITAVIIGFTLAVAILVPNVETVLSLTGATMGTIVSFILPSVIFLNVAGWNAEYSIRAKVCLVIGMSVMLLSTTSIIQSEMNGAGLEDIVEQMQPMPAGIDDINGRGMIGHQVINAEHKDMPNLVYDGAAKLPPDPNVRYDDVDQVHRLDKNNLKEPDHHNLVGGKGVQKLGQNIEYDVLDQVKIEPDHYLNGEKRVEKPGQAEVPPQPQVPPNQEQHGQGENQGENIPQVNPPHRNLQAHPAKVGAASDVREARLEENRDLKLVEEEGGDQGQLQNDALKLSAQLNQLEEENKGLKERQKTIEQNQVEELLKESVAEEKKGEQNGGGNDVPVARVDAVVEIAREKEEGVGIEGENKLGRDGGVNHDVQRPAAVANENNAVGQRGQVEESVARKQSLHAGGEEKIAIDKLLTHENSLGADDDGKRKTAGWKRSSFL